MKCNRDIYGENLPPFCAICGSGPCSRYAKPPETEKAAGVAPQFGMVRLPYPELPRIEKSASGEYIIFDGRSWISFDDIRDRIEKRAEEKMRERDAKLIAEQVAKGINEYISKNPAERAAYVKAENGRTVMFYPETVITAKVDAALAAYPSRDKIEDETRQAMHRDCKERGLSLALFLDNAPKLAPGQQFSKTLINQLRGVIKRLKAKQQETES